MNINKAATYSLLAHVRNSGKLITGPMDVFVPLAKRVLYLMNQKGITRGENIGEIRTYFEESYSMDIPIPVLKSILEKIANELNTLSEQSFKIHLDNSFVIKEYVFEEFEDKVQKSKNETEELQKLFEKFKLVDNHENIDNVSIFDFIDKSKLSLSKYLCNTPINLQTDFTVQARFVAYFKKIPHAYDLIKRIYLGSILSSFLEYKTENIQPNKVELLFDTNFIISLIDLNTTESTHTCNKLLEVGQKQGYKLSVLADTIEETQGVIRHKAQNFNVVFLQSRINPEDIYNACARRKLNRVDLERIADNLEKILLEKGVIIIPETTKYRNIAKFSKEYTRLKKVRNSEKAALHDATALQYVQEKRSNKKIKDFERVTCWFVHNSNTLENDNKDHVTQNGFQPNTIKADELLNILWLTNPSINREVDTIDIAEIGLSAIVAFTLNDSLPKASIIKELDDNIQKYAQYDISDNEILLVSTRITNRQLSNIPEINELAKSDSLAFVRRLRSEAKIQEQENISNQQKMADLFKTLSSNSDKLVFEKNRILEDEKLERIENDRKITELERLLEEERIKRVEMEDLSKKSKKLTVTSEPIFLEKMKNSLWILIVSIFLILVILAWAKPGTEVDFFGWFKVKQGTDQNKGSSDIKMEATNHIVSVIGGIKINGNNKSPIKIGGIKISNLTSVPSVPLLASNKFLFEEVDISNKQFLTIEIDFANGTFVLSEPLPLPDKATKVIDVKGLLFEVTEKKDDKARPIVIYKQQYNQINGNSGDIRQ